MTTAAKPPAAGPVRREVNPAGRCQCLVEIADVIFEAMNLVEAQGLALAGTPQDYRFSGVTRVAGNDFDFRFHGGY